LHRRRFARDGGRCQTAVTAFARSSDIGHRAEAFAGELEQRVADAWRDRRQ
jgi:hypothetical protein